LSLASSDLQTDTDWIHPWIVLDWVRFVFLFLVIKSTGKM